MTEPTDTKPTRKRKAKTPSVPTEYVVLMNVVPLASTELAAVYPDDVLDLAPLQDGTWLPVGNATTKTKKAAIDAVVGGRGGTFKAVAASSWKGGERRFEQTRITSEPIE